MGLNTYTYKCEIIRVIDGDTFEGIIDLGFGIKLQKRIRVLGVNTPELRSSDEATKASAYAAKHYVEETFPSGTVVLIRSEKGSFDSFGRVLARVETYFGDLADVLVKLGHGEPVPTGVPPIS